MPRRLLLTVLMVLVVPAALAGVVVETEVTVEGEGGATETIYVEGERFRTDPASAGNGEMSVIFRDDTMWFVDHDKKKAQKIDKQAIADLAAQLEEMNRQLKQMPPEQQEMMRKMMAGKMPGMQPPPEYLSLIHI